MTGDDQPFSTDERPDDDVTLPPAASSPVEDATSPPNASAKSDSELIRDKVRYFGDYELLEEIARGGMGVVYKARQTNLNRVVALKMILAGQFAGSEDVQRFYTEAEAAARLDHWGIVPIYEIGEHQGQHYFSMAYVEGESLADKIRQGPIEPRDAAALCAKIAEAIGYAHEKGVIHRDLKPANILLDRDGTPKVTDFGLAKQVESDSDLTRTGAVMGTPSFMPPEQASGDTDAVGPLADVYSLGAMLYTLLTGRPPFQAANPLDTLMQVLEQDAIAPRDLNPEVDRDLETITLKCLAKQADRRYGSAEELEQDMKRFLNGDPIQARPPTFGYRFQVAYRKHQKAILIGVFFAFAICAGFAGTTVMWTRATRAETRALAAKDDAVFQSAQAKAAQANAEHAQNKAEDSEASAKFQLALARWDANRVREARQLLHEIPTKYRDNFEWHYCNQRFLGSDVTMSGHQSPVWSVCYSPDGKQIASASEDQTIRVWDAITGDEIRTLKGHDDKVYCVCFSPDGKRIASSSNQKIKVWDAAEGTEIFTLSGHSKFVLYLCFSPDGEHIASVGGDRTIKIWDSLGREIKSLECQAWCAEFSPDGRQIAAAAGRQVVIWDVATASIQRTFSADIFQAIGGPAGSARGLCYSPDGTRIAYISPEGIKVCDATTGVQSHLLRAPWSHGVCFSPDGQRIASACYDNTIHVWDVTDGRETFVFQGHTKNVRSVCFSPDGKRITSASEDKMVKVWDAETGQQNTTLFGFSGQVTSVCFSGDGKYLASGQYALSPSKNVKIWDIEAGLQWKAFGGNSGPVLSVAYNPDGSLIASGNLNHTITLWDATTGKELKTLTGHTDSVNCVCFSNDGSRIASASRDKSVKLWDTKSGENLQTLTGHSSGVSSVQFSPDGSQIASGGYRLKIWNSASGELIQTFDDLVGSVFSLCFSPDAKHIATGSDNKTITLWDIQTGNITNTLEGHSGWVSSLCFSADGKRIISGSSDKTIKVWDVLKGTELISLSGHQREIEGVCIAPDGKRIVSASTDGTVKIWSAGDDAATTSLHTKARPSPRWHQKQAETAIAADDWFAAAFHTGWLLTLQPDSPFAEQKLRVVPEILETNQILLPPSIAEALSKAAPSQVNRWRIEPIKTIPGASVSSWSADGRFLAYGQGNAGINIMELETGEARALNEDGKDPAWSPAADGMIAFVRASGGAHKQDTIWVVRPDGTQERQLANGGWPSWSADGKTLYFIDPGQWRVMSVAIDQADTEPQIHRRNVGSYYPAVSPDGQSIAYQDSTGAMRIIDAASGKVQQRIETTKDWRTVLPRWSPDGNSVLVGSFTDKGVFELNAATGTLNPIHVQEGRWLNCPSLSPDGMHVSYDDRSQGGGVVIAKRLLGD